VDAAPRLLPRERATQRPSLRRLTTGTHARGELRSEVDNDRQTCRSTQTVAPIEHAMPTANHARTTGRGTPSAESTLAGPMTRTQEKGRKTAGEHRTARIVNPTRVRKKGLRSRSGSDGAPFATFPLPGELTSSRCLTDRGSAAAARAPPYHRPADGCARSTGPAGRRLTARHACARGCQLQPLVRQRAFSCERVR
jgi:hypothetical protein